MEEAIKKSYAEDPLSYCQQCHKHNSECSCDTTHGVAIAETPVVTQAKTIGIMMSTWTVSIKDTIRTVERIVVKDLGIAALSKDETYLKRVKRELNTNDDFKVLDIKMVKKVGETAII
jgi:hypothetical protein